VPIALGGPPGTGPFGVGIIAWVSTTNFQSPGPDCIATASPPSVVAPAKEFHPIYSTCPTPGIT